MSQIDVKFAQLHDGLFLAGTNFGNKLDIKAKGGLKMTYDRDQKELIVEWNGQKAFLPSTSVHSYQSFDAANAVEKKAATTAPATHKNHPQKRGISSAQVQTPMGHVFEGEGAGVTGVSTKV